ncbi:MAG: hypothetical protein AB7D06_10255 [Pedobacter sp.]
MEHFSATYEGKKHKIIVDVGFEEPDTSNSHRWGGLSYELKHIFIDVYIENNEKLIPIKEVDQFRNATGPKEVFVRGWLNESNNELQIENIQKGIINPGQHFLLKILKKLIALNNNTNSIYLANVNHGSTLELLKKAHESGQPLSQIESEARKPLMFALDQCGYTKHELVLEGTCLYGIRGFKSNLP